jgi:hypothetical protein
MNIESYHRPVLVLALSLLGFGCQSKEATPPPTPAAEQAAPTSTKIVVVRGRVAGDRACYLNVEDEKGQSREEMASFELCEREDLVGRRARLHFGKAQVMAESCQGNPDCPDTETVDLVNGIDLLPGS